MNLVSPILSPRDLSIVVIDDQVGDYELIYMRLRSAGVGNHIEWFASGESALGAMARIVTPAVLLLDISMPPGIDGVAFYDAFVAEYPLVRGQCLVYAMSDLPIARITQLFHGRAIDGAVSKSDAREFLVRLGEKLVALARQYDALEQDVLRSIAEALRKYGQ